MKNHFLLVTAIAVLFTACGPTEKDKLRTEVDSLRSELQINQQMAQKLNEIGVLMDSIDANRQVIRLNVVEGISKDDYVNRMEGLKSYVRSTEDKIEELESTLKKSKSSNKAFSIALKKLKAEIESKNQEIALLTETVNKYKAENENLVKITETQGLDIMDKLQQIEAKKQEVAALEQRIDDVSAKAKEAIASGYLAHAKTVEQMAEKIKFAPKKKKAALAESLELYRKAALYGNDEAKTGIERIEQGLN
jgi:DNA repair exonuclease SbcCD ATPase subunit